MAKLVSQPRAQAEACRHLARRERVRRMRLSPTQRKWRLGEARVLAARLPRQRRFQNLSAKRLTFFDA